MSMAPRCSRRFRTCRATRRCIARVPTARTRTAGLCRFAECMPSASARRLCTICRMPCATPCGRPTRPTLCSRSLSSICRTAASCTRRDRLRRTRWAWSRGVCCSGRPSTPRAGRCTCWRTTSHSRPARLGRRKTPSSRTYVAWRAAMVCRCCMCRPTAARVWASRPTSCRSSAPSLWTTTRRADSSTCTSPTRMRRWWMRAWCAVCGVRCLTGVCIMSSPTLSAILAADWASSACRAVASLRER